MGSIGRPELIRTSRTPSNTTMFTDLFEGTDERLGTRTGATFARIGLTDSLGGGHRFTDGRSGFAAPLAPSRNRGRRQTPNCDDQTTPAAPPPERRLSLGRSCRSSGRARPHCWCGRLPPVELRPPLRPTESCGHRSSEEPDPRSCPLPLDAVVRVRGPVDGVDSLSVATLAPGLTNAPPWRQSRRRAG
jgi:hypothetical protein